MQNSIKSRISSLDGLRFIAAAMVVAHHFMPRVSFAQSGENFRHNGYMGVTFFFVLSGFVLTYKYVSSDFSLKLNPADFAIGRLARIYPVYLFALLCYLPFALVADRALAIFQIPEKFMSHKLLLSSFIAQLLCIQAWVPAYIESWNPAGWSISVELFLYLAFPWAVSLFLQSRNTKKNPRLFVISVIVVFSLLKIILALTAWKSVQGPAISPALVERVTSFVNFNPLFRLPDFIVGMGFCFLFIDRAVSKSFLRWSGITCSLALLFAFTYSKIDIFMAPLLVPIFGILIFWFGYDRGAISRILGSDLFTLLGKSSYSFYLLQYPLYFWFIFLIRTSFFKGLTWGYFLLFAIGLLFASMMLLVSFEEPVRRFIVMSFRQTSGLIPTWYTNKRLKPR